MNVGHIPFQSGLASLGFQAENGGKLLKTAEAGSQPFDSFFNAYMNMVSETNNYQIASDQAQLDYAAGRTDDMLAVMLSQEKATASLNFTIQVTNKIIEAYKEIMRIAM